MPDLVKFKLSHLFNVELKKEDNNDNTTISKRDLISNKYSAFMFTKKRSNGVINNSPKQHTQMRRHSPPKKHMSAPPKRVAPQRRVPPPKPRRN